ncbi:alpha/beta fold hydrolase [Actinokineospora terrae]|uniref:Alpha/beta hydrolase family protein n=1 Tax=Actinokineospora terrae TaxID=155974 RepID=A0A1H9V863_9PSEU|nr:alpha/beta hydrolase [Actinokineospora terrae]SES17453.1 Alpha/beta hydrolase family protein [Actinokineospora terrae]
MGNFVLVAGARLGAWAWDDVVPHLRAAGHGVHAVTLSGLAEKQDVPAGQQIHVQDIVDVAIGLRDVVLVGHSYAGIPVCQAAQRIGDRLNRVLLIDASVAVDGESFAASWQDGGAELQALIVANGGWWPVAPASHFAGHDLTDDQITRILTNSTPHPGSSLTEPAELPHPLDTTPTTYIASLLPHGTPTDPPPPHWRLVELNTGHWPMFSQPRELARILLTEAEK